jgi:RNase H-like domain found in reverse transcriptase
MHPLICLTKKDETFSWSNEAQHSFKNIKGTFVSAPILHHFDPKLCIILETDASDYTIAAIISQVDENNEIWPVTFCLLLTLHAPSSCCKYFAKNTVTYCGRVTSKYSNLVASSYSNPISLNHLHPGYYLLFQLYNIYFTI